MSQRKRSSELSKPIDFYKLFEVKRTAPVAEIKQVYRMLAWEHHPDRGGDASKMAEYTEAWQTLRDPRRRKEYDKLLATFSVVCGQCRGRGVVRRSKGFGDYEEEKQCGVCCGTGVME